MINKIRQFFSRFSMLFLFSANVFFVILLVLTVISLIGFSAYKMGFRSSVTGLLTDNMPVSAVLSILTILLLVSLIIGVSVIIGSNATIFKPLRRITEAMKELANGNFNTRIELSERSERYYTQEIKNFINNFNATAQELSGIEMLRKDFINDFSHEFKTPIVSIGGFANLILEEKLSKEEIEEYLRIIASESERLAALATNVLNITKVETQTIITGKSLFNISEQIRKTILLLETKLDEKELELDLDINEIECYGNAEMLNQVWVNLLDNAVKFSPKGAGLTIKLFNFYDSIVFKIKDNGIGMNEETIARVFDKFYQGDSSRTTQGNGLGLALVKKIVSLHGGEIEIESLLNNGTTVTVLLPRHTT